MPKHRRQAQNDRLVADGRKAVELIRSGVSVTDCLMLIGGSRARLYRAMARFEKSVTESNESETK